MAIEDFFQLDPQIQYILGGIILLDVILVYIFLRVSLHAVNAFKMDGKNRILTMLLLFVIDLIIGVLLYEAYIELESSLSSGLMLGFWLLVVVILILIAAIIIKYRHQTSLGRGFFVQLIMGVFIGIIDLLIIFGIQFGLEIDLFSNLLQLIQDFL
jgi:hypothetical protein